jgi:hypothetical protein
VIKTVPCFAQHPSSESVLFLSEGLHSATVAEPPCPVASDSNHYMQQSHVFIALGELYLNKGFNSKACYLQFVILTSINLIADKRNLELEKEI